MEKGNISKREKKRDKMEKNKWRKVKEGARERRGMRKKKTTIRA